MRSKRKNKSEQPETEAKVEESQPAAEAKEPATKPAEKAPVKSPSQGHEKKPKRSIQEMKDAVWSECLAIFEGKKQSVSEIMKIMAEFKKNY